VRSLLVAPGNDERKLLKALESGADAAVADLEDAVVPAEKETAREVVGAVFGSTHDGVPARLVRVNGAGTPYFAADLEVVAGLPLDGLVLPKATPQAVAALGQSGPPVVAIVETAAGVRAAYEVAASPRVAALMLGAVDLAAEVGIEPRPDGLELLYARSKLVFDSAAAGIRPPFDVVHLDVRDDEGLEEECRLARSLGLLGKACIHPAQVPVVERAFAASDAEVEWARSVVDAFEAAEQDGAGVLALDGAMVDLPVVTRARRILSEAERRTA
jgi:citrate lyase subunit beta/citryl-CoA lyase